MTQAESKPKRRRKFKRWLRGATLRTVWFLIGGTVTGLLAAHSAFTRLPCALPEPGGSVAVIVDAQWPWPTIVTITTIRPANPAPPASNLLLSE